MERRTIHDRTQRKMRERDRRIHMRNQLSNLASVLPNQSKMSVNNLVDEATSHIKKMKRRIDQLELRRTQAKQQYNNCSSSDSSSLPILRITSIDSTGLQVNLITGFSKKFKLHEVIQILQEEGAQVTSFSSTLKSDDGLFVTTIISQPICARIGMESRKIAERLQELICS